MIPLVVVLAVAWRVTSVENRLRGLRAAATLLIRIRNYGRPELEVFRQALRARRRWTFVTFSLLLLNVAIFAGVVSGTGSGADPATLLAWGASFGPRTTNGEWWRLLAAPFVHDSLLALFVNMALLVQVGFILERLVGSAAFATTYGTSGLLAGLANLALHPLAVRTGAADAVFGLCGLLAVSVVGSRRPSAAVSVPTAAIGRLAPWFLAFLICNGGLGAAELVALATGVAFGLVVATHVTDQTSSLRRLAYAGAAAMIVAVVSAIPLRGMADVRPEIERLVAVEGHTADVYRAAAEQFRKDRLSAGALVEIINRTIVPALEAADERFASLKAVPREDEPRVAEARQYLKLRSESWQLRAEGLREAAAPLRGGAKAGQDPNAVSRVEAEARHRSSTRALGKAETVERAALQTLARISPTRNP